MRVVRGGAAALALVLTLGLGAAACSKSGTSTTAASGTSVTTAASVSTTPAPPAAANTIKIKNFMFVPGKSTAKVGATITVTNMDGTDHSFTADDGSFDTGIFSSGSKTITVTKAGTFAVHCRIHNFMTGSITVS
jgi:plastocyanin